MNSILTLHLHDSMGIRGAATVTYPTSGGVPAAHRALVQWEQQNPTLTVLGTHGWPASLLPTIPRDPLRCVA